MVGLAGDSQLNKTIDCIGFILGCQKAATQSTQLQRLYMNNDSRPVVMIKMHG
jgi:hypothetical protein